MLPSIPKILFVLFLNDVKDSPLQCFSSQCDVPSPVLDPFLLPAVQFSSACQLQEQESLNLKQVLHPCLPLSNQLWDSRIDALARTEPRCWKISRSPMGNLLHLCFGWKWWFRLTSHITVTPLVLPGAPGQLGNSKDSAQVSGTALPKPELHEQMGTMACKAYLSESFQYSSQWRKGTG